jgi:hypothetical protein
MRVNTCCGCLGLETGDAIFGLLGLIAGVPLRILYAFLAFTVFAKGTNLHWFQVRHYLELFSL